MGLRKKENKDYFHYLITAVNTIIAILALYLAFSHNKQLTAVDFLWESWAAQYIPVDLQAEQECPENCEKTQYFLPVWFKFKILNTGFRVFTVDHISVFVVPLNDPQAPSNERAYYFSGELVKEKEQMPSKEIIAFPVIIEPGHSKEFLKKVKIPIPKDVYVVLKHKFKGDKIEINSFEKRDYIIFQKYKFYSHVTLADGQVKIAHVKID
jgi:hypothetical protein